MWFKSKLSITTINIYIRINIFPGGGAFRLCLLLACFEMCVVCCACCADVDGLLSAALSVCCAVVLACGFACCVRVCFWLFIFVVWVFCLVRVLFVCPSVCEFCLLLFLFLCVVCCVV